MSKRSKDEAISTQEKWKKPYTYFDDRARIVYLESLERTGMVGLSAKACGVTHRQINRVFKKDEAFAEACQEALCAYRDRIEAEAHRRAVEGVEKGVWYRGARVGTEQEYSDSLMQTLLKGNRPEKYRDRLDVAATVVAGVMVANVAPKASTRGDSKQEWADGDEVIDVDGE